MIELEPLEGRRDIDPQDSLSRASNSGNPDSINAIDVVTQHQAETFVRGVRRERWATVSPKDAAVAFARMDVADALYAISPDFHPEYTPEQKRNAAQAIELVLKARDRIVKSKLGHLNRPEDAWADTQTKNLEHRYPRKKRTNNMIYFAQGIRKPD